MQFNVYRPDSKKPDELHVGVDKETLDLMLSCLDQQYQALDRLVVSHSECNRTADRGCNAYVNGNCYDELGHVHEKQMQIIQIMKDARIVRENPEVKDANSFRQAQAEARQAREVALRTFEPTAKYDIIQPKASDGDGQAPSERREVDPAEVTRIQTMVQEELGSKPIKVTVTEAM